VGRQARVFCYELAYECLDNPWWDSSIMNPNMKEGSETRTRASGNLDALAMASTIAANAGLTPL